MKSVCFVVQSVYDFDPRVARKAEALVAAGYSVDVLALRAPQGKKSYSLNGVNVYTLSLGKNRGSLARYFFEYAAFFLWAFVRVPLQMLRRRYAVVDLNSLPDFLIFAPVLARWMGAKLILDLHEITPEFYMSKYRIAENSWTVRMMKCLEKISVKFADHVITVNQPIEDLLVQRGLSRPKSTIIMNAVDEARFAASPSRPAAPVPRDHDKFVMMYHGTLTSIYGLDIAIEAFALVHKGMPGAELWILGSGPEKSDLTDLAQARGLDSKVRMVGQVASTEISTWLTQCDVGILPIRRDVFLDFAFPNKLPEFIIMGKPVIISRLKAIRHYFSEDALAFCEPNSPADLSQQMLRIYRDPQLRIRLPLKAREEYAPIRWDLMKERYLSLIDDLAGTAGPRATEESRTRRTTTMAQQDSSAITERTTYMMDDRALLADVETAARKLLIYCRDSDWAGYDPYDALNSRLFTALPLLNSRLPRLVLTQSLKRSPINVRRLLQIPKTQNPKAIAVFLSALLKAPELSTGSTEDLIGSLMDRLVALRSPESPYWCWGYSFPWQTRTIVVPRATPNLVCTTFVAGALLDLYERRQDAQCLTMAVSAAEYILNDLYWTDGDSVAGFSYPLPSLRIQVHNANFLAAALFCRLYKHTGEERFLGPALRAARYSAGKQHADGSWNYGEAPSQRWIDNFHTGYNLCALQQIDRYLETDEFDACIRRGLDFYRVHFFRTDGAPRYFHNSTYPIDIHCVAQSIITLLAFRDLDPGGVPLAHSVFRWAMNHMWDDRGFFYYRVLRFCTIRTSYMRWSQAWMLLALSTVLDEANRSTRAAATTVIANG